MLDDCQLVHPVHERVAFLDNAFELAPDTGDQFIPGKEIVWVDRHLPGLQEIGLDHFLPEFNPVDQPALLEFFNYPRALPAVNAQFFPEFALENAFGP